MDVDLARPANDQSLQVLLAAFDPANVADDLPRRHVIVCGLLLLLLLFLLLLLPVPFFERASGSLRRFALAFAAVVAVVAVAADVVADVVAPKKKSEVSLIKEGIWNFDTP
jgi:hypothetical protein